MHWIRHSPLHHLYEHTIQHLSPGDTEVVLLIWQNVVPPVLDGMELAQQDLGLGKQLLQDAPFDVVLVDNECLDLGPSWVVLLEELEDLAHHSASLI